MNASPGMDARLAKAIINGLLVGLAVLSVAPLLWMLSVSFMQPGEASSFPPPLRRKSTSCT